MEVKEGEVIVNVQEAKAAVYDYLMSRILDKDFESVAAVAGDVLNAILKQ